MRNRFGLVVRKFEGNYRMPVTVVAAAARSSVLASCCSTSCVRISLFASMPKSSALSRQYGAISKLHTQATPCSVLPYLQPAQISGSRTVDQFVNLIRRDSDAASRQQGSDVVVGVVLELIWQLRRIFMLDEKTDLG